MGEPLIVSETGKNPIGVPPKGTITVKLYKNKPYTTTFEGDIIGNDLTRVWLAINRQYKLWKHNIFKQTTNLIKEESKRKEESKCLAKRRIKVAT